MSCDRKQRQAAQAAGVSGGVSPSGSQSAGATGQAGQVGGGQRDPAGRAQTGRRQVRRAVKAWQKMSSAKKEKLYTALGEAALAAASPEDQKRWVKKTVREFGAGVVAAGLAAELKRLKQDGDDWGLKKYEALPAILADLRPPAGATAVTRPATASGKKEPTDQAAAKARSEELPTQYHLMVGRAFSPEELDRLQTTALLSSVATKRQLEARRLNAERGHGHSDPRAQDWMTQDLNNFRFVSRQLGQARRNGGKLDTAALDEAELLDLWEFSRFEADRALRNVDHLLSGWSHLQGETADHLGGQLRLEARFYSYLAQQLEPRITPELRDKYQAWEVE